MQKCCYGFKTRALVFAACRKRQLKATNLIVTGSKIELMFLLLVVKGV